MAPLSPDTITIDWGGVAWSIRFIINNFYRNKDIHRYKRSSPLSQPLLILVNAYL